MKHNFHAIIGPNGMCECGVRDDGTVVTCGGLLEQEIAALHGSEAGPQEAREEPSAENGWMQSNLTSGLQSDGQSPSGSEAGVSARVLEWQDISTAPSDGTRILGCRVDNNEARCEVVYRDGGEWTDGEYTYSPTHWIQIPSPPVRAALGVSPAAP